MKTKLNRLLILSFACLAVVSLVSLEIVAFHQYNAELNSRKWVNHTYVVIETIETLGREFRKFAQSPRSADVREISESLQIPLMRLISQTSDNHAQQTTLLDLKERLKTPLSSSEYIANVWAMVADVKDRELVLLKARREDDEVNASKSYKWITLSTLATGALLMSLFTLAAFDYRFRRRVEADLASTLSTMIKANAELTTLNKQKNEMLKNTVHDLKNPLGSIAGFAELIGEESTENQSVLDMVAVVKRISQQTLDLVGGILEDSALRNGERLFRHEQFNVVACVTEAVSMLRANAKSKSQVIVFTREISVAMMQGDQAKLRDAFLNTIGNALKFSPPSSSIYVGCQSQPQSLRIIVEDEGPGISVLDREKLFRPGQRLSAQPTGHESSTGLGLSIVKEIVERHMGHIFYEAREAGGAQKGARFIIELPVTSVS